MGHAVPPKLDTAYAAPLAATPRRFAMPVLATIALVWALKVAAPVLVPVVFAILVTYILGPSVERLARWRVPRVIGAGLLLAALVGLLAYGAISMGDAARTWVTQLPETARELTKNLKLSGAKPLQDVQRAADEFERAKAEALGEEQRKQKITVAPVNRSMSDYVVLGSMNVFVFMGEIMFVVFLAYFLLVAGDRYRRKMAKIAGPTLTQKRLTIEILDEINAQIERFLVVQLIAGVIVGLATWAAFAWLGVNNAGLWGVAAGVLNMVPYVGPIVVTVGSGIAAFLQFQSLAMAATVGGLGLLITSVEGYLLMPWLTAKASKLNPVAALIGLAFWGWLWGAAGLFLAIPLMMILKAICDRVEGLQPLGELLG